MTLKLFDNGMPAWIDFTVESPTIYGNCFSVSEARNLEALRWYRGAAGTNWTPNRWGVFDTSTGTEVVSPSVVPDDGTIGWQRYELLTPFPLVAGRLYCVAYHIETTVHQGYASAADWPPPPAPLTKGSPVRRFQLTGAWGYPTQFDSINCIAIDVEVSGFTSAGTPTPAGVDTDLGSWLSNNPPVQEHEGDGLPWQTKLDTAALIASLGNTATLPGGTAAGALAGLSTQLAAGILAIKGVDGATIAAVLTALANLLSVANNLKGLLDGTGGGGRVGGDAGDGKTVLGVLADIQDQLDRLEQQHLRAHVIPAIPGDNWEFLANTEVTPNIAWDQEADAYLLNISAFPPRAFGGDKSAGTYLPRVGWWCPLNVDFAVGQEPIRFAKQMLWLPGVRMNGVAVELLTGSVGVIEAWRYAGW